MECKMATRAFEALLILALAGCGTQAEKPAAAGGDASCQPIQTAKSSERAADMAAAAPVTKELAENWLELKTRDLRLLPVPKKLRFTGEEISADKIAVVVVNDNPIGTIAANEIVSRIEELCGKRPPLLRQPAADSYNIVIENVYPNTFIRDAANTSGLGGEQAYGLYPAGNSIVLAGCGNQGTLWAAVTARWLFGQKNGATVFYPARISDWPDFAWREAGRVRAPYMEKERNHPERHLEAYKPYIDFTFRQKCNLIYEHCYQPFQGAFSPFKSQDEAPADILKSIRKVNDYAKARGIKPYLVCMLNLGDKPFQKSPELDEMFLMPYHNSYVSWTRLDLHRARAKKLAAYCLGAGYSLVQLHSPDGGGVRDPEMWSCRAPADKAMYSSDDDRPRADWAVFKEYYETLKQAGLEVVFIDYPYSAASLNENNIMRTLGLPEGKAARRTAAKLAERTAKDLQAISALVPKDVSFLLREETSPDNFKNLDQYSALCPGRSAFANCYVTESARDMLELLPPESSSFRSMFKPFIVGIEVYNENRCFTEPALACAAEYTWNTAFPGWSYYERQSYFNRGGTDAGKLEIMAERAAVGVWGAKAGKDLKDVFDRGLSIDFAIDPEGRQKQLNLKDMPALYAANHSALVRAEKAFDRAWLAKESAAAKGEAYVDKFSRPFFTQYYLMIKGAMPYSIANLALFQAQEELSKGNMDKAGGILKEAKGEVDKSEAEFKRVFRLLADEPMLWRLAEVAESGKYWRELPKLVTLNPDIDSLRKGLSDLYSRREEIFQQRNVPVWFGPFLQQRCLYAPPSVGVVKIDGAPDEAAWAASIPVEHFAGSRVMSMPSAPVSIRALHDQNKLYLSGRVSQSLAASLDYPKHGAADYVPAESVELLLTPDPKFPKDFLQVALDISGNVFTHQRTAASDATAVKDKLGVELGVEAATKKTPDGWSFELSLPFDKLGAKPGKGWKGMLVYNRAGKPPEVIENYASSFTDGRGFLKPELYSPLLFSAATPNTEPVVAIKCSELDMKDQLHSSGTGSLVSFKPELESRRPLKDVSFKAVFLGKGKERAGGMDLKRLDFMPLQWRSPSVLQLQLEEIHPGVIIELQADYQFLDGRKGTSSKRFILGDAQTVLGEDEIFRAGAAAEGKALATPAFFETAVDDSTKFLDMAKGEISFKFMPKPEFTPSHPHCLFHFGPLRKDSPLSYNRSSLLALIDKNRLVFNITSDQHELRSVSAPAPAFKNGAWVTLAFKWDLDAGGKTQMAIYADGKEISGGKINAWSGKDGSVAMPMRDEGNVTMQVGCLNSGGWTATGFFKDFRLSSAASGELSFGFDGTLDGFSGAKDAGQIKAHVGTMRR